MSGFPNVGERCLEYINSEKTLLLAEARLDLLSASPSLGARNLLSLIEHGTKFFRARGITLSLHGNSVRLTHADFLVLAIAAEDGFFICSGERSGERSPRLTIGKGDLEIARITTVRLIEDAIDATAQHLARRLSEEKSHA